MAARFAALLLLLFALYGGARAQDTGTDASMVVERYLQHFMVEPDGSYTLTVDNAKRIVQPRAVQAHGQYYISYNKTLDEVLSVEAHTLKADGRRVPVQPHDIHDQQEAASADAPMFQDTRLKIVVFPEVEVGDQLVLRYVVRRHTPLFPGHFEDLSSAQFYSHKHFELIYDMPPAMPFYADAAGFVALPAEDPPGRTRYRWRYASGDNQRIEADSVSYLDYGKRLAVSSFANYAAFAQAFQVRAHDKALPDEAIIALARQVTAGLADTRARALALSDWVRRNIRYVGVHVGPGGVVPHDARTVLRNRYGDCKDHAVLLEALLAAAGIESTGALINNGDAYHLPRTPTLGIFNHMITWVPALDLYLDPTAESVAAGYLPRADLGKPVLLVKTGKLASTPARQTQRNKTVSTFIVHADGRSDFKVEKHTSGAFAEPYRYAVRNTPQAERDQLVQRMLQGLGQKGSGVFDAGLVDGTGNDYRMAFSGTSENFVNLPGPAGLSTTYNFWVGLGEPVFGMAQEKERHQDFICHPVDTVDELSLRFPKGVRIVALPRNAVIDDGAFSYRASYARRGNSVTVRRHLVFRHDGPVCKAAEYRRMLPALERIMRDLRGQVVVQGT